MKHLHLELFERILNKVWEEFINELVRGERLELNRWRQLLTLLHGCSGSKIKVVLVVLAPALRLQDVSGGGLHHLLEQLVHAHAGADQQQGHQHNLHLELADREKIISEKIFLSCLLQRKYFCLCSQGLISRVCNP